MSRSLGLGAKVVVFWVLGFWVQWLGCRVQSFQLGFKVQSLGFSVSYRGSIDE